MASTSSFSEDFKILVTEALKAPSPLTSLLGGIEPFVRASPGMPGPLKNALPSVKANLTDRALKAKGRRLGEEGNYLSTH